MWLPQIFITTRLFCLSVRTYSHPLTAFCFKMHGYLKLLFLESSSLQQASPYSFGCSWHNGSHWLNLPPWAPSHHILLICLFCHEKTQKLLWAFIFPQFLMCFLWILAIASLQPSWFLLVIVTKAESRTLHFKSMRISVPHLETFCWFPVLRLWSKSVGRQCGSLCSFLLLCSVTHFLWVFLLISSGLLAVSLTWPTCFFKGIHFSS